MDVVMLRPTPTFYANFSENRKDLWLVHLFKETIFCVEITALPTTTIRRAFNIATDNTLN